MRKILIVMGILMMSASGKDKLYCDIKGNVNNPGVYEVKNNYTIKDIIKDAGGLKSGSYTDKINLSKKVKDEMVIYIPTKYEINKINSLKNCDCSNYIKECDNKNSLDNSDVLENEKNDVTEKVNDDKLKSTTTKKITSNITTKNQNTTTTTKLITTTIKEIKYPININQCNLEDLLNIKGLGEVKAKKIIEYRESNGEFKGIEDIKNVSGIGDVLFNKIKEFITI